MFQLDEKSYCRGEIRERTCDFEGLTDFKRCSLGSASRSGEEGADNQVRVESG